MMFTSRKIHDEALPEIERRHLAGETLQQIAASYGCSRERIRQILRKLGVAPKAGGNAERLRRAVPAKDRQAAALKGAKEARALAIYGMPRDAYEALASRHGSAPYVAYSDQRRGARKRGIEWRFTFAQWWSVWEASGKWAHRGRRLGQYVMSRPGDRGPYSPDNVAIVTNTENVLEQFSRNFRGNYSQTRRRLASELEAAGKETKRFPLRYATAGRRFPINFSQIGDEG